MYEAEKKRLGVTHCEVGSWLAGEWSLPESLVDAIANHHTPRDSQVDPLTTAITHLADILCKMSSIGFGGDDKGVELKGDPAWGTIREKYHHIESLDLERFTFELEGEIEKAKALIHI